MTISQAKEMDLVDYLATLGYHPTRVSTPHYWYKSPSHDERTPSFKINRQLNRWYDFSEGKGGNLVDFGTLYHHCNISVFLQKLDNPDLPVKQHLKESHAVTRQEDQKNRIKILSVKPIVSPPLITYYRKRRITDAIAFKYLQEVVYELKDKKYYALGFKNDAGGYELRNQYIKASSAPKGITFIENGANNVAIFEGFFNFLSHRDIYHKQDDPARNFLILNSTCFFEKNLPLMEQHGNVHLYLDNDKTGQKYTQNALALDKQKFRDERQLYQKYNDLNDWLVHSGHSQKQQIRQKR